VRNLAWTWAEDLKGTGIRVNVLSPGATATELAKAALGEEGLKAYGAPFDIRTALVLRRPVAGPNHGADRTRSDPSNGEVLMSAQENAWIVKDFFAAMGSGDK
jgi:NAD(P)-dependent dehydrogenase (short-subunit alcohol dehydrogenase family)